MLVQAARLAKLLRLPDRLLVTYLPDDAFYYLALAQNFARTGRWTFDGVEPATGFHLLWAYLLAALYKMAPHLTLHGVLLWGGVFQTLCLALAAWLVVRTAEHVFNEHAEALSAGVGLIFLSSISLVIDTSLMESPLLILASAATLWLLCRAEPPRGWGLGRAFALGLAGMLARSDFGLLPAGAAADAICASPQATGERTHDPPGRCRTGGLGGRACHHPAAHALDLRQLAAVERGRQGTLGALVRRHLRARRQASLQPVQPRPTAKASSRTASNG